MCVITTGRSKVHMYYRHSYSYICVGHMYTYFVMRIVARFIHTPLAIYVLVACILISSCV